jgi:hypothetical protein
MQTHRKRSLLFPLLAADVVVVVVVVDPVGLSALGPVSVVLEVGGQGTEEDVVHLEERLAEDNESGKTRHFFDESGKKT